MGLTSLRSSFPAPRRWGATELYFKQGVDETTFLFFTTIPHKQVCV